MTTEKETKQKPLFYIFETQPDGKLKIVGSVYPHKKGNGANLNIGFKRYVAFPPKAKPETEESA